MKTTLDKYYWRNYYKKHKEKRIKSVRTWQNKNKDKVLEILKIWKKRNPEKTMEYRKRGYIKNKKSILLWMKENNKKRRLIVLQFYGGNPPKCACCGEMTYEFLALDHINNDGAKHRRNLGMKTRGGNINGWIIKNNFPDGFQVLCHNCNCAKGFYGKCPHKETNFD